MPTYQYACTECGDQLEVVQRFSDDPLTTCGPCGGRLRKVFSPVGIVFKGSGFYRNDSRADSRSGSSSGGNGQAADTSPGLDGSAAKAESGSKSGGADGAGKVGKRDSDGSAKSGSSGSGSEGKAGAGAGSTASAGTGSKVA